MMMGKNERCIARACHDMGFGCCLRKKAWLHSLSILGIKHSFITNFWALPNIIEYTKGYFRDK